MRSKCAENALRLENENKCMNCGSKDHTIAKCTKPIAFVRAMLPLWEEGAHVAYVLGGGG